MRTTRVVRFQLLFSRADANLHSKLSLCRDLTKLPNPGGWQRTSHPGSNTVLIVDHTTCSEIACLQRAWM